MDIACKSLGQKQVLLRKCHRLPLFGFCRILKNLGMHFWRCLFSWETITLGTLLGLATVAGMWYGGTQAHADDRLAWSTFHMFSLEATVADIRNACGWWKMVPFLLYVITWLIGGGILLGVLIGQSARFWRQVRTGKFRYNAFLYGHYLVFGWEPNCITLLRDVCDGRRRLSIINFWTSRPRFVILSECSAEEIVRQVSASFKTGLFYKKPFKLVVYHGQYDSPDEFGWLNIEYASSIFVTGEFNEPNHDSRVLLLLAHLNRFMRGRLKGTPPIKCRVRIDSHVLYRSLRKDGGIERSEKNGLTNLHVRFFNFYDNWARRVWEYKRDPTRYFPRLDFLLAEKGEEQDIDLLIVGFGNMGQSLALRALRQSVHYGGRKVNIFAVDADMGRREPAFNAAFGDLLERFKATACVNLEPPMSVESAAFENLLKKVLHQSKQLTVVITLPKADEALESALQIAAITKDSAKILLRQNVYNSDVEECRDALTECYDLRNIFIFGSQDGAGFGNVNGDKRSLVKRCRNLRSDVLLAFAHSAGQELVKGSNVSGRYVIGGALGYDAALAGNYDIDLRLLVPDAGKSVEEVRREIDSVKDLLAERAKDDPTFKTKFIDEGGTNYIWHTKQIVKVQGIPGDPDVELTWNIQAESTYRSIAEMAARLPKEVIDRYVIAKWNAQQAGKGAYKALKEEWKSLMNLLIDHGGRDMDEGQLYNLLESLKMTFPSFLTGSVS